MSDNEIQDLKDAIVDWHTKYNACQISKMKCLQMSERLKKQSIIQNKVCMLAFVI
jgi:hypothetical protein